LSFFCLKIAVFLRDLLIIAPPCFGKIKTPQDGETGHLVVKKSVGRLLSTGF